MALDPPARKSLGQHWLRDAASLQAMCDAAEVQAGDTVLEIGSGPGSLTELLVARAGHVTAVEFDEKLATALPERVQANNLKVVSQDILRFDLTSLPANYKVVANIPYYLTSNLIRVLSETSNQPLLAAILIQKEVAERVVAQPGAMSILSVTAQFYWQTSLGKTVSAELFTPPPKVDSQILILKRRPEPLFPEVDPNTFFRFVKAGFSQRRKTLLNALSGGLQLDRGAVQTRLQTAGINPARRAQTLSLDEWHHMYTTF